MSALIIDGKAVAASVNENTRLRVEALRRKGFRAPGLAVVLVGSDPASQVYVRNKVNTCAKIGINSFMEQLPDDACQEQVLNLIKRLNADDAVDGILVQSPPPPQIDEAAIVDAICPDKDVDCFCERNVGRLNIGCREGFMPCTPWGIMELLRSSGIRAAGKHAVIVGRSNIVGKPLAALLLRKGEWANAAVTVVHSGVKNLADYTRSADILIAAVGKPEFIRGDMIKPGAAVIDVGINRVAAENGKGRLVGDVCFSEAVEVAGAITPVPGGVGPMTIAGLMRNAVWAAEKKFDCLSR